MIHSRRTRGSRRGEAVASQTVTQQPCLAHCHHGAAAVQALVQDTPLTYREKRDYQTANLKFVVLE